MKCYNYIEGDGECRIALLVKKMALQKGIVHPVYGEIHVKEFKDNDIITEMDGNDWIIRISSIEDKRKYSYISWTLISAKTSKVHGTAVTRTTLENAKAIRSLQEGEIMNTNSKSEKEICTEAVVPYMTTFMNELTDGNSHVVERTVAQMKQKFALDDAQEAALQIVLFNIETMYGVSNEDFNFKRFLGLNINIIIDIVLKDYRSICDHRLADSDVE